MTVENLVVDEKDPPLGELEGGGLLCDEGVVGRAGDSLSGLGLLQLTVVVGFSFYFALRLAHEFCGGRSQLEARLEQGADRWLRAKIYLASKLLGYHPRNGESEPDTLGVHLASVLEAAKELEEAALVFPSDAHSVVQDGQHKLGVVALVFEKLVGVLVVD